MFKRAYIHFNPRLVPGGFLVVPEGEEPSPDDGHLIIQNDIDFPVVAATIGYKPCPCGQSDGTTSCCGKPVLRMIAEAWDYLTRHADKPFTELGDYARRHRNEA